MTASPQGSHELLITRTFDAPVALVFQLWKERDHMIQWWGPKDFTCTHLDLDFREGGSYRACISSQEHGDNWMHGRFFEIVENQRIVMSFAWEEGPEKPEVETRVTVTFADAGGQTVQRFHQVPFVSEESRDSHVGGWNQSFDREQQYAARLAERSPS
jgi:uncharacterized protein YndB with AHSA1/START domain